MPKLSTDLLTPNQVLKCGDYLTSRSGNYYAAVLPDGNFCIYAGDSPDMCRGLSWSSNNFGQLKDGSYALIMQSDGNLCVYESYDTGHGTLIWQSQTASDTSFAVMQDDGNFCIYWGDGQSSQRGFRWGTIQNGAKTSSFGALQPITQIGPPILHANVWHRIGAGAAIPDMPAAMSCKIDSVDILLSNSGDTSHPDQGSCFVDVFSKGDDGLFYLRNSSLLNGLNFSNTASIQRLVPSLQLILQEGDFVGLRVESGFMHLQWTDGGSHKMWWDTDPVTGKPGRYVSMVSCGWAVNVSRLDFGEIITPSNLEMNDVESVFDNISTSPSRRYYKCSEAPTSLEGMIPSHFKGIAFFADKLIFSHTNLGPNASNGKYIIADGVDYGDQGSTNETFDTPPHPDNWCHPCGSQACGSFMAMGIQKTADGSQPSEIQIYDIRMAQTNQPIQLIGSIKRSSGINGVAITKETGNDGKYIVAGVQGNRLTVYKSKSSSLIPNGADRSASVEFTIVIPECDFDASGAGLALVTQTDGAIYLFSLNADDDGSHSQVNLYKLEDLQSGQAKCSRLKEKQLPVTVMSDSVTLFEAYFSALVLGLVSLPPLSILIPLGFSVAGLSALILWVKKKNLDRYLNSSFRWGKGLKITSPDTIEIYVTDRNVFPLSKIPMIGSNKDFSVLVWENNINDWSNDIELQSQTSSGPALTVFNNQLYCVHQGVGDNQSLWVTSSVDGSNWSNDTELPDHKTSSSPALVVFNNKLYCVHQGVGDNHSLWVTYFDGSKWSRDKELQSQTSSGPALTVFNNKLYCVHQGVGDNHSLWVTYAAKTSAKLG